MGGFLEEVTPDLNLKALGMGRMGVVVVAARRRDFWAGVASDTLKWTEYSSYRDSGPLGLLEKRGWGVFCLLLLVEGGARVRVGNSQRDPGQAP